MFNLNLLPPAALLLLISVATGQNIGVPTIEAGSRLDASWVVPGQSPIVVMTPLPTGPIPPQRAFTAFASRYATSTVDWLGGGPGGFRVGHIYALAGGIRGWVGVSSSAAFNIKILQSLDGNTWKRVTFVETGLAAEARGNGTSSVHLKVSIVSQPGLQSVIFDTSLAQQSRLTSEFYDTDTIEFPVPPGRALLSIEISGTSSGGGLTGNPTDSGYAQSSLQVSVSESRAPSLIYSMQTNSGGQNICEYKGRSIYYRKRNGEWSWTVYQPRSHGSLDPAVLFIAAHPAFKPLFIPGLGTHCPLVDPLRSLSSTMRPNSSTSSVFRTQLLTPFIGAKFYFQCFGIDPRDGLWSTFGMACIL